MKHSPFVRSKWIWPDMPNWDIYNSYALFRREFSIAAVPRRAPLFITADQSYQLYVNGRYVCRGPARGFQSHWPYDEIDIQSFLREGRNVIAVRSHNPGVSNFQYLTQGYAGLLVAAKWGRVEIISDNRWKARRQNGVNRNTTQTSLQLFCQEHVDLRVEDPDWMHPDFDDSSWDSWITERPWNSMPWEGLEERAIPMLEENLDAPRRCLGWAQGNCHAGYSTVRDITSLRHAEGLAHQREERSTEEIKEIVFKPAGIGKFRSFLIDFGRTVVGSIGFEISGAMGGEIVDTLHAETVDLDSLAVHFEPGADCKMAFGHRLICQKGKQTYLFYHAFGFRYMVVTVRDNVEELIVQPLFRTALYPLKQRGSFRSSDVTLERIWETCAWTQRVCSLDAYVDTPWREQAQWWGDARVQAKNTFFYAGDTRLFRRGIAQIASQTLANGLTYGHAPTMAHNCILPDFTLVWLITLWDYYWQTGSLEPFQTHWEAARKALSYFEERADAKTGLVGYDDRYWLFLDWTGLFKDGYSSVYNLWLLITLQRLSEMCRVAGLRGEGRKLAAWAARLRSALKALVQSDGLLVDGLTFSGEVVQETSVHAQTLAILADFQPQHHRNRLDKIILPYLRDELSLKVQPSSYWINYVFEVVTTAGYGTEALAVIRKKWEPMVEHGTTWEVFQPRLAQESFSHAWSAHPLYHMMQILGGIRQSAPGWKGIIYQPLFEGTFAEAIVPTPFGDIVSSWKEDAKGISVELALPKGISADIRLPDQKGHTLSPSSQRRKARFHIELQA